MGLNHKKSIPKAANSLQEECIRVQKVYDWVTDTFSVTKQVCFNPEQLRKIEEALEDPARRPLRLTCQTPAAPPPFPLNGEETRAECETFLCEQVGEKRDVTVSLNGNFVDAQLVELLFTSEVRVAVVDRNGRVVTHLTTDASVLEPFVLCYPDGTDLFCKITRILCKIQTGTVLLNAPAPRSFNLTITFCVDIQIEAEVKLEVLAKFCSPRNNDLSAEEAEMDSCPEVEFPAQCPDIFPRPNCDCSVSGEASGRTGSNSTEKGRLSVLADICQNCSLSDSSLHFTFEDENGGLNNFDFTADSFEQDSLTCEPCEGKGLKLMVSGVGTTNEGEEFDFNFAAVSRHSGSRFQLQLIDERGVTVFESGIVKVDKGSLEVEDCVTFDDIKLK
ncbi:hypothetical protein [Fictibacillus sp. KU28468]|uniref:hypothetical protein n=1 Tax=Fictibacillus sp. KU28468 TaxID=2991053 RepID=UPI00223C95F0|nr:hypothetical protein [Fictibacillus sp. KU28468]UZJ77347.1 hypothetical protein OKX00_14285 [Fictibacillus sp. KU28468]